MHTRFGARALEHASKPRECRLCTTSYVTGGLMNPARNEFVACAVVVHGLRAPERTCRRLIWLSELKVVLWLRVSVR